LNEIFTQYCTFSRYFQDFIKNFVNFFAGNIFSDIKGTGTQDLIWLKVVSLDRSWLVGLTDDVKHFLKCCFLILIIFYKSLVVLAKIMPIANVNRIVFVN